VSRLLLTALSLVVLTHAAWRVFEHARGEIDGASRIASALTQTCEEKLRSHLGDAYDVRVLLRGRAGPDSRLVFV
jgi:hypothetical protein